MHFYKFVLLLQFFCVLNLSFAQIPEEGSSRAQMKSLTSGEHEGESLAFTKITRAFREISQVLKEKTPPEEKEVRDLLKTYHLQKGTWKKELIELNDSQAALIKSVGKYHFKIFQTHIDLLVPGSLGKGSDPNKSTSVRINPETGSWDVVQTLVARSSYDLQRIDREAAISQKLRGKANIITIDRTPRYHVVGQEGDYISLYTKWSSKGSVSQWLESSPPLMERAKVALGVVRGMQHMESAQVAHHDIKTDNILLNDYLVPAWTDFGESDHVDRYPQYVRGYIKNRSPEKVAAAVLPAFVKEAGFPELSEQLSTGKISLTEARSFLKKYEAVPISEDKSESLERALKIIDQLKEYKTDVFALGLVLHEIFHFDPKRGTSSANQHPVVKDVKLPRFVELQLENHEKEATVNVTKTLFRYPGREEKLEEPLKNPSSRLLHQVDLLIRRMLDQNPQNRPSQKEVYESLKKIFE